MPLHVLRPIRESDLPHLQTLADSIKGGLTTLPNDPAFLEGKIVESTRSFDPRIRTPGGEHYLFVLEDVATGEVVGTSGIAARVGGFEPFYSYELRRERFSHAPLAIEREVDVLHLKRSHKGPSEICSLFLRADCRSSGLGRLLSLARFHFIAAFRSRFDDSVIAEMRGYLDEAGRSPFWESVGWHFFQRDYSSADFLSGLGNKDFIEALMPKYPIYVSLLPTDVQAVVGRVHRDTEPALKLLQAEGFASADEVDIFDAGPIVRAATSAVRSVRECRTARVRELAAVDGAPDEIVSNRSIDFRACLGAVATRDDDSVTLSPAVAEALRVRTGDTIGHAPARATRTPR